MSIEMNTQVENTILKLETVVQNQCKLDQAWSGVKSLLISELDSLPDLPTSNNKKQNHKFKKSQPFWNENLTAAWKDVCQSEKDYLLYKSNKNSQAHIKARLRDFYKKCQNTFDSKYRYFKRKHKKQEFDDLGNDAKNDIQSMWKKLSNPPSTRAALEILREDKSISNDVQEVLQRWHKDISILFSGLRETPDFAYNDDFYQKILTKKSEFESLLPVEQDLLSDYDSQVLNDNLSYDEVSKAIDGSKLKKAYLIIPNEALKNKNAKILFINFFNFVLFPVLVQPNGTTATLNQYQKKTKTHEIHFRTGALL